MLWIAFHDLFLVYYPSFWSRKSLAFEVQPPLETHTSTFSSFHKVHVMPMEIHFPPGSTILIPSALLTHSTLTQMPPFKAEKNDIQLCSTPQPAFFVGFTMASSLIDFEANSYLDHRIAADRENSAVLLPCLLEGGPSRTYSWILPAAHCNLVWIQSKCHNLVTQRKLPTWMLDVEGFFFPQIDDNQMSVNSPKGWLAK